MTSSRRPNCVIACFPNSRHRPPKPPEPCLVIDGSRSTRAVCATGTTLKRAPGLRRPPPPARPWPRPSADCGASSSTPVAGFSCRACLSISTSSTRRHPSYVKIDIWKYFASISHERLPEALFHKTCDPGIRSLFARIVRGFNEGNERGCRTLESARSFVETELGLGLKGAGFIQRSASGVSFLAFRIYPGVLRLSRRRQRPLPSRPGPVKNRVRGRSGRCPRASAGVRERARRDRTPTLWAFGGKTSPFGRARSSEVVGRPRLKWG